jgi:hypothetical protein
VSIPANNRPLRVATGSFLVLMCAFLAFALAGQFGLMDALVVQRAIGALVGILVLTIGSMLPKLRPLSAPPVHVSGGPEAERFAGWLLMCVGLVHAALFLFAPLGVARMLASVIGGGALIAIAANAIWHARGKSRADAPMRAVARSAGPHAVELRNRKIWLFTAFVYVLLTSILSPLGNDHPWARRLDAVMAIGFAVTYAVLLVFLQRKRPSRDGDSG